MSKISIEQRLNIKLRASFKAYVLTMFKHINGRTFVLNWHHDEIINKLQQVVDGRCKRLIINMPPRYSKTELIVKMFISYCYSLNAKSQFLHLSYSDTLVTGNSEEVKEVMSSPLYKTLFPGSHLKGTRQSNNLWYTEQGGSMYAVSTQGQVTGFGAGLVDDPEDQKGREFDKLVGGIIDDFTDKGNIFNGAIIIDDPIKPEDALSEAKREKVNQRFENTIRNRVNSRNTPIIIVMQRLHPQDLAGYLQKLEPDKWDVLTIPAIITNKRGEREALWSFKHTLEELQDLRTNDPITFDTQYQQNPTPLEGLMYSQGFETYNVIPDGKQRRINYTDTADRGKDFLCSINAVQTDTYIYVTDVLYTDKPMTDTQPLTARMLEAGGTEEALVESNNGGEGFKNKVDEIMRTVYKNRRIVIRSFHQSQNKLVRINTNSAQVQNTIRMPEGWQYKWPRFYNDLMEYRKEATEGDRDDAPDAVTGLYEMAFVRGTKRRGIRRRN